MITRVTPRFVAVLAALTLFGALATASIRLDAASQAIRADAQETAAFAATGMDIPALTAKAGMGYLPVLSVRDPI